MDSTFPKQTTFESSDSLAAECDRLAKEKAEWLDRLAKFYFPDHIYELARSRKRMRYCARWIEDQGYEVREVPDQMLTQFCRTISGKLTVLAEFRIELRGKSNEGQ